MHLLAATPGAIADGSTAVDLGQTRGEIIVLSSADTEITLLASAQKRRRAQCPAAPSLRLAPILRLGHNFSVDLYMETVARARLVIARVLGGSSYWSYGIERLVETCRLNHIPLALLPGDDKPDPELTQLSTLAPDKILRLWRYLAEGGPANADNFLRYAGSLIGCGAEWAEPAPLLRAGLHWPGRALPKLDDIALEWRSNGGIVTIIFYRALVQSGNTSPVDALAEALSARGLCPLPIFVQSLKDGEATALVSEVFAAAPPAVILNATGFSASAGSGGDPLATADCPVLQIVFAGSDEESWRDGTRGLGARDLAMNVALPEIDGRILSRAVSFKAPLGRDPDTEADLVGYRPVADRIAFVADLARNWARLQHSAAGRPPHRIGAGELSRTAMAASATASDWIRRLRRSRSCKRSHLRDTEFRDAPQRFGRADRASARRPDQWQPGRAGRGRPLLCRIFGVFRRHCRASVQQAVVARWGAAERDPFFRPGRLDCGRFAIPGFPRRQCRGDDPAGARLQHRPEIQPITIRRWCRRTLISRPMPGLPKGFAPMPLSISASTARSNGCPGKALGTLRRMLPRGCPRPAAASLSIYCQ